MTADNISRDEAIEIVGQELFGEAWWGSFRQKNGSSQSSTK